MAASKSLIRSSLASLAAASMRGGSGDRHPLAPAALRVERSRLRHSAGNADQTAVTVWFGTGPSLPAPGARGETSRAVLRAAAGVLGAAALAAMALIAARREAERLEAAQPIPRLEG